MARHKGSDYGKTWWNCDYCKLSCTILRSPLNCEACDKRLLEGATPEYKGGEDESNGLVLTLQ